MDIKFLRVARTVTYSSQMWVSTKPGEAQFQVALYTKKIYTSFIHCTEDIIMSKEAVFTMKLEPDLRAEFMAETEAIHRPASQVLRELMREFVERQREAREYDQFLRNKVEASRTSMRAGLGHSNDTVEANFAARRAKAAKKA